MKGLGLTPFVEEGHTQEPSVLLYPGRSRWHGALDRKRKTLFDLMTSQPPIPYDNMQNHHYRRGPPKGPERSSRGLPSSSRSF